MAAAPIPDPDAEPRGWRRRLGDWLPRGNASRVVAALVVVWLWWFTFGPGTDANQANRRIEENWVEPPADAVMISETRRDYRNLLGSTRPAQRWTRYETPREAGSVTSHYAAACEQREPDALDRHGDGAMSCRFGLWRFSVDLSDEQPSSGTAFRVTFSAWPDP